MPSPSSTQQQAFRLTSFVTQQYLRGGEKHELLLCRLAAVKRSPQLTSCFERTPLAVGVETGYKERLLLFWQQRLLTKENKSLPFHKINMCIYAPQLLDLRDTGLFLLFGSNLSSRSFNLQTHKATYNHLPVSSTETYPPTGRAQHLKRFQEGDWLQALSHAIDSNGRRLFVGEKTVFPSQQLVARSTRCSRLHVNNYTALYM